MPDFDFKDRTLGWVGTGRMGYALATRLLEAGCDLAVYNRTRVSSHPRYSASMDNRVDALIRVRSGGSRNGIQS